LDFQRGEPKALGCGFAALCSSVFISGSKFCHSVFWERECLFTWGSTSAGPNFWSPAPTTAAK
jgi:hypothetical protein